MIMLDPSLTVSVSTVMLRACQVLTSCCMLLNALVSRSYSYFALQAPAICDKPSRAAGGPCCSQACQQCQSLRLNSVRSDLQGFCVEVTYSHGLWGKLAEAS